MIGGDVNCVCTASKCYKARNMYVLNPYVHVLGDDAAVIAYTALTQNLDKLVLLYHCWQLVAVVVAAVAAYHYWC